MMAKGIKTGGRKVGTPNKLTKEIRAVLKDFVFEEIENLPNTLKDFTAKERLEFLAKLLPFVIPKVDSVSYQENEPINFSDGWS